MSLAELFGAKKAGEKDKGLDDIFKSSVCFTPLLFFLSFLALDALLTLILNFLFYCSRLVLALFRQDLRRLSQLYLLR